LRQAQQSALVRQDEITQLHRDNERLLTENRGTQRELSLMQDQLKHSNQRQDQLLEQATRVDSERTLLQERLRVATAGKPDTQTERRGTDAAQSVTGKGIEYKSQANLEESQRLAATIAAAPDSANPKDA
jgi:septal ring factor EnvC (AmiA/AmiB activator)